MKMKDVQLKKKKQIEASSSLVKKGRGCVDGVDMGLMTRVCVTNGIRQLGARP